MSRTYRKIPPWLEKKLKFGEVCVKTGRWTWDWRPAMKKDWALARADHGQQFGDCKKYFMNHRDRVRRMAERRELNKIYRCVDYEDVNFDISDATRYERTIWWIID